MKRQSGFGRLTCPALNGALFDACKSVSDLVSQSVSDEPRYRAAIAAKNAENYKNVKYYKIYVKKWTKVGVWTPLGALVILNSSPIPEFWN